MQGLGKILRYRYRCVTLALYAVLLSNMVILLFTDYGAHIYARVVPGSDVDVAALSVSTSHYKKAMMAEEQPNFETFRGEGSQGGDLFDLALKESVPRDKKPSMAEEHPNFEWLHGDGSQGGDLFDLALKESLPRDKKPSMAEEHPNFEWLHGDGSQGGDLFDLALKESVPRDKKPSMAEEHPNFEWLHGDGSQGGDLFDLALKESVPRDKKPSMAEEHPNFEWLHGDGSQGGDLFDFALKESVPRDKKPSMAEEHPNFEWLRGDGSQGGDLFDLALKESVPRDKKPSMAEEHGGGSFGNQAERQRHLQKVCKDTDRPTPTAEYLSLIPRLITVDLEHPILYCPVQKVASTLWVRLLTVLGSKGKYTSPFDISLEQKSLTSVRQIQLGLPPSKVDEFTEKLFSFMFVRDPYSRLFSAYVDKVYMADPLETETLFPGIIKGPSLNALNAVTFADFIQYLLQMSTNGRTLDKHVAPMHTLCDPCALEYDFLGKLETLIDDTNDILDKWGETFDDVKIKFTNFPKEAMLDDITRRASALFNAISTMKAIGFSKNDLYSVVNRVWGHHKIRGYISKEKDNPFMEESIRSLKLDTFLDHILTLVTTEPLSAAEAKQQRTEAMIKAYRTVRKDDLEMLRLFVLKDCEVFDYDDRPEKIFDMNTQVSDYNYFSDL